MKYDYIIVGAGIVGLATALKLYELNKKLKILVLEKEGKLGVHQTGNNSGVIHSGIYYKPGSLKAKNCRRGYELLLEFCRNNDIEHDICGKLIVATNEYEVGQLQKIFDRGIENGLENLRILNSDEMKDLEPFVEGRKAIHVPQTGIIDFRNVLEKYAAKLNDLDCQIKFNSEIVNIRENTEIVTLETNNCEFSSEYVISCAGLQSDKLAKMSDPNLDFRIIPFRGEYYKLINEGKKLVRNLVYPVPDPSFPFLGVHFTRKIDGDIEAGPNAVFSFSREGYGKHDFNFNDTIDSITWRGFQKVAFRYWRTGIGEFYRSINKRAFTKALQKLVPDVTIGDLEVGGVGIRAQACDNNGNLIDDFLFNRTKRILHVCNAPSPAATASLAIGEYISNLFLN